MSGAITATQVIAAAAVASTAYSVYQGEKMQDAQREAQDRQNAAQKSAEDKALKQEAQSQTAVNRAQQKAPDIASISDQASKGAAGTMLTSPTGIDPSKLSLSKNSLLGG